MIILQLITIILCIMLPKTLFLLYLTCLLSTWSEIGHGLKMLAFTQQFYINITELIWMKQFSWEQFPGVIFMLWWTTRIVACLVLETRQNKHVVFYSDAQMVIFSHTGKDIAGSVCRYPVIALLWPTSVKM